MTISRTLALSILLLSCPVASVAAVAQPANQDPWPNVQTALAPFVVGIKVKGKQLDADGKPQDRESDGIGLRVGTSGLVITSWHVIEPAGSTGSIWYPPSGESYWPPVTAFVTAAGNQGSRPHPARTRVRERHDDIAVLQVDELGEGYPACVTNVPPIGAELRLLRYPPEDQRPSATVQADEPAILDLERRIPITAFAKQGDSGSPAVDRHGRIVGILAGGFLNEGWARNYLVPSATIARLLKAAGLVLPPCPLPRDERVKAIAAYDPLKAMAALIGSTDVKQLSRDVTEGRRALETTILPSYLAMRGVSSGPGPPSPMRLSLFDFLAAYNSSIAMIELGRHAMARRDFDMAAAWFKLAQDAIGSDEIQQAARLMSEHVQFEYGLSEIATNSARQQLRQTFVRKRFSVDPDLVAEVIDACFGISKPATMSFPDGDPLCDANLGRTIYGRHLTHAVFDRTTDRLKALLETEWPIESTDPTGRTALLRAIEAERYFGPNTAAVQLLLDSKADPDASARTALEHARPLHAAAAQGTVATFELILERTKDLSASDRQGRTALDILAGLIKDPRGSPERDVNCRTSADALTLKAKRFVDWSIKKDPGGHVSRIARAKGYARARDARGWEKNCQACMLKALDGNSCEDSWPKDR